MIKVLLVAIACLGLLAACGARIELVGSDSEGSDGGDPASPSSSSGVDGVGSVAPARGGNGPSPRPTDTSGAGGEPDISLGGAPNAGGQSGGNQHCEPLLGADPPDASPPTGCLAPGIGDPRCRGPCATCRDECGRLRPCVELEEPVCACINGPCECWGRSEGDLPPYEWDPTFQGYIPPLTCVEPQLALDSVVQACASICSRPEAANCAASDESAQECAEDCAYSAGARDENCQETYPALLGCIAPLYSAESTECGVYKGREIWQTCPEQAQAFIDACGLPADEVVSHLRQKVSCQAPVIIETDGACSFDIEGCSDGMSYSVRCGPGPVGGTYCDCSVDGQLFSTGDGTPEDCSNDRQLDLCGFPIFL